MNNHSSDQNWFIVGHGAIGLLWANFFSLHNPSLHNPSSHNLSSHNLSKYSSVSLILRNSVAHSTDFEQTQTDYTVTDIKQKQHVVTLNTICLNSLHHHKTIINKLLIPVKAYDVQPALEQLQPFLSDTCTIVLCHNGMGTIEKAQTLLKPKQSLYFATTTHGAYKPNKHHVMHTGLGETKIGLIQGTNTLAKSANLLAPTVWQQDIAYTLWNKLAINCAINPLTAIHQCKNGALAEQQYRKILTQICEEFCLVANRALNNETVNLNLSGLATADDTKHADLTNTSSTNIHSTSTVSTSTNPTNNMPFDSQTLLTQCLSVIAATANNYSSMHQDVHHGRISEIDYITGFIINKAKALNLSVPTHQLIYRQFSDITSKH